MDEPKRRPIFHREYLVYALKLVLWMGMGKVLLAPAEVGKVWDVLGLVGFIEVGLVLVGLLALWIGCNYLWCLGLQKLADRKRLRLGTHPFQKSIQARWRRRGRWLHARFQRLRQPLRIQ